MPEGSYIYVEGMEQTAARFSTQHGLLSLPIVTYPHRFSKDLKRKKLQPEDYLEGPEGLKIYELVQGKGPEATKGAKVQVHYDVIYRSLTVVSSRQSRLLGGNRTIAEPYEFIAGEKVRALAKLPSGDSAGGLFTGAPGPRPPQALSNAVLGMKVGGKRSVLVPPELAYGTKGEQEIPPGATIELQVELLELL